MLLSAVTGPLNVNDGRGGWTKATFRGEQHKVIAWAWSRSH